MTVSTFSSREFTRDVSAAKKATIQGPVFITDRGRPAYALLKIDDYYKIVGRNDQSFLAVMDAIPGVVEVEFDPPHLAIQARTPDFE